MTVVMMPGLKVPGGGKSTARGRQKYSVALSGRTAEIFDELKELTDPETDSEIFRNALRINYMMLKARESGFELCLRETETGVVHPLLLSAEEPVSFKKSQQS